jgi:very-short-patch-repair endonuclease
MKDDFPRFESSPALRRKMTETAREFRKKPTKSEAVLWQALRGKQLDGLKFRRQQPIGPFVVDFYNSVYHLVIEIDGSIHDVQKEADITRQHLLGRTGLTILRLKSETVEMNLSLVLDTIRSKIEEIKLKAKKSPSP